jgi:threonyl-tRNA synthetase
MNAPDLSAAPIPPSGSDRAPEADKLHRVRHSLAHVLAAAVQSMRPGTKLGFGPPIEDGFYYDFILAEPITKEDFPELERRMREILRQKHLFVREDLSREEGLARIESMGEPYKREYAAELMAKQGAGTLGFYRSGAFVDMCDGPHVASTQEIPEDAFQLRSVAGAYWRGDSKNVMMTRIYAWAFLTADELAARRKAEEEAAWRDHKKLGIELDIFAFDDEIGRGLPLWLPNGTVLRDELEKLMRELEFEAGFQRVATPHLAKQELYFRTGHLPYYAEHMFPFMHARDVQVERAVRERDAESDTADSGRDSNAAGDVYCLRPMNCPHHHKIFAARKRSYRELPLRLAEYGQLYRYEDSGAVSGLLRVRGMTMNDGHIYCTKEQVIPECIAVLEMHKHVYEVLGLSNFRVRLSRRELGHDAKQKFVEDPESWDWAEATLREVLEKSGLPFEEGAGEAAFYGPKIDFQFRSVTGREETASTLQLDFAMPKRLDLRYVGPDGAEHRPFVLHRAPLGTHERFVALLLEHFGGAFPTWLAPVQVGVVPVSERFVEYGERIVQMLRKRRIRAELDPSNDAVGKKIRHATLRKIPNVLVVGEREVEAGTVTLRRYGSKDQRTIAAGDFADEIARAIETRSRA